MKPSFKYLIPLFLILFLPSGWFDFTLEYRGLGEGCFLRSSSAPNSYYASIWMLESQSAGIERADLHPDDAIPLRCLKN